MFYGQGAGELPTASAVVGDVFETARNIVNHSTGAIHCGCYKHLPIKKIEDIISRYFLRMEVEDKPGVLARWPACWEIIPSASSRWCRRKNPETTRRLW